MVSTKITVRKDRTKGINMAEQKETKYRNTRETGLNWLANQFGGMAGKVVKEKRKKKEKAKKK